MISKDQSITTQVAFKAATDMAVAAGGNIDAMIGNFAVAFSSLKEIMDEAHGFNGDDAAVAAVVHAFPGTQMVSSAPAPQGQVRIAGKQHGPIPEWLITAASRDGVTEVWDNRDKATAENKRPLFKAVSGDKAYWDPSTRRARA